jgi:hypothetical protein
MSCAGAFAEKATKPEARSTKHFDCLKTVLIRMFIGAFLAAKLSWRDLGGSLWDF